MSRPTDDELEAMAVDLVFFHPGETSELAAAMLRAMKGRAVKPLPRGDGDGEGGWTLPVELLAEIRDEVYANEWDAPCAEVIEIIALSVEARVLAAEAERDALRAELADAVEVLTLIESIRPMQVRHFAGHLRSRFNRSVPLGVIGSGFEGGKHAGFD